MEPSESNRRNLLLFLLILALFVGGSMEFSHGSAYVGALFFVLMFILMLNVKINGPFNFVRTATETAEIVKNEDHRA